MLAYCSYSYSSETIYGTTPNAASDAYNWVMTNVLPQQLGLTVNSVIYRYTTEKNTEDDMLVHVQNENLLGNGYIFRSTDDWSGLPGNTINKTVPVGAIGIDYWGDGSIEIEGSGSVVDPEVYYAYSYIPCQDPQNDPSCPGYIDPLTLIQEVVIDTSSDEYIQNELDREANLKAQKEEEEREAKEKMAKQEEKKVRVSLEKMLGLSLGASLQNEQDTLLHNALVATNYLPRNYFEGIRGGDYPETIMLKDKRLPDNKKGLRVGLAQELKHQQLIKLQYDK
ncbi:hypothetical protein OAF54_01435 [bacterium]|nr:hypothetical protein [bacterium]